MSMQVEARASRRASWPVPVGGCADRRHALVPVGCSGQRSPARWCVSLRTPARRSRGSGGGGCPASPGRWACGRAPGRSVLGPVLPAGLYSGPVDHGDGFEFVDHRADGHGPGGAVGDGLGLMGQATCGDTLPGSGVAIALPAAAGAGAQGPLPAGCGGAVGGLAVAQRGEAAGAVPGGATRGDGDDGDAHLGGQVPHPFHDPPAYLLGEARVEGAAHAAGLHRPEVLDVDHARVDAEGLVDCHGAGLQPRRRSAIHAFDGSFRPWVSTPEASVSTSAAFPCPARSSLVMPETRAAAQPTR